MGHLECGLTSLCPYFPFNSMEMLAVLLWCCDACLVNLKEHDKCIKASKNVIQSAAPLGCIHVCILESIQILALIYLLQMKLAKKAGQIMLTQLCHTLSSAYKPYL